MSSVMDPGSCAPSTSTTAGIIVQSDGRAYVGTMNLNIYEAPMPQMRLPTSIECNVQDPNIPFIGREGVLNLLHNNIGDGETVDETTALVPGVIMSESKKIGCLAARTWTLVVASLSIVSSLIMGIMTMKELSRLNEQKFMGKDVIDGNVTRDVGLAKKVAAVDFFMAFVLIFGVHDRSSCAVLFWLCYYGVATLLIALLFHGGLNSTQYTIGTVIFLCVRAILISVVRIHWKEIGGSPGQHDVTRHRYGV